MIDFDNIVVANNRKDVNLKISAPIYFWLLFLSNKKFYNQKYITINDNDDIMESGFQLEDYSLENTTLCDVNKKYIEELKAIKDKYDKRIDYTKHKNCLIQLVPSGLNLDKYITIHNVSEYCHDLVNNLSKHEIVDIHLHHNEYPLEFKDYLFTVTHIARSI